MRERLAAGAAGCIGDWNTYASRANRDVLAIAPIEDAASLKSFDTPAAPAGIDAYFVGPTDLSRFAWACPGQPSTMRGSEPRSTPPKRHGKIAMTLIGNRLDRA